MSASDKKKLRKEQQSAALTEKQLSEKKTQKKQKAYTWTFVVAMVLILAIVLTSTLNSLKTPVKNLLFKNAVALTVNEHEITGAEFNYYYMDYISNFYNQFSSGGDYQDLYVQMYTGLNPAASLDSQVYNQETGETWADYFADCATESIEWTYSMYDAAMAEGFKLSESEQKSLDSLEDTYEYMATYYGYSSTAAYLKALYGSTASMKTFQHYSEVATIASSYASAYVDSLEFTDKDFREHEADKMKEYNSYSYAYFYVNSSYYLTGGTTVKGEDGKETTTYSDEEKAAALKLAEADAQALAVATNKTVEALNLAIGKLTTKGSAKTATETTAALYNTLPSIEGMSDWITSEDRVTGDITYIPYATHSHAEGEEHSEDEDESKYETVNGYYVVLFLGSTDNTMNVGTVRHLLVKWETDKDKTEPTQAQKDAAKAEAEKLLAEFNAGDKTEKSFTELLTKHTDDINSTTKKPNNDGLYSEITPDSGYVKAFSDWACADHEKGDVEIIETEHGYHIMYYVEAAELNYRDTLINNDLIDEAYEAWQEALVEKSTTTEGNLKHLNRDLIISR